MDAQESHIARADLRFKVALLIVSLATIVALAFAMVQENRLSDWYTIRHQYGKLLESKATDEQGVATLLHFSLQIVQNYVPRLGAVDRCITCHAGVEDPRMRDQPQPFTTHPGRYLEIHDPEKFGCTVCHEGQGRATTTEAAHGRTPYWDDPLFESRFVKSTCTTCHVEARLFGEDGLIARADGEEDGDHDEGLLARGRRLFRNGGCRGCHMVDGKGGPLGPDLSEVGDKTHRDFDFSRVDPSEPREATRWLYLHFLDPQALLPDSPMAPIGSERDAAALTAYVLSLRAAEPGGYYFGASGARTETDASGAQLYAMYCSACHGPNGEDTLVVGVHTPALNNQSTLAVADDAYYRSIITSGRSGSYMPTWGAGGGGLESEEIDRIVAHIRGWQREGPDPAAVDARAGAADAGALLYEEQCVSCHGWDGEGGIGSAIASESFLAVADDAFLAETIVYGRRGSGMPAGTSLTVEQINDIIAFVREWAPKPPPFAEVSAVVRSADPNEQTASGQGLYAELCRVCHGAELQGGIGPSLGSDNFLRVVDDEYLYRAITEGRPGAGMPAWRSLSADDVAALIAYLRSHQSGGQLTLAEVRAVGDPTVGEVRYRLNCERCHGPGGAGGSGPQIGNAAFLDSISDAALFHWIAHGRPGTKMEGFLGSDPQAGELSAARIIDVIAFLRDTARRGRRPLMRAGTGDAQAGKPLYDAQCASCHGANGEGTPTGLRLNSPALLRAASDGLLAATIVVGRTGTAARPMVHGSNGPARIPPEHVMDVVAYLRRWESAGGSRPQRPMTQMSAGAVESGAESYRRYCAPCHGEDGGGKQGGDVEFAPSLKSREFQRAASDGFLLATIVRGRIGTKMAAFGEGAGPGVWLKPQEISDIVSFIRSWRTPIQAGGRGGADADTGRDMQR